MFFEDQRCHIRKLTDAVHDGKAHMGIVLRDRFNNWCLREADANNKVVPALGKSAHRRLNRRWITWFDIPEHDWEILRGSADALPGRGIEGTIVLARNVEDYADMDFGFVVGGVASTLATCEDGQKAREESDERAFHARDSIASCWSGL